MQRLVVIGSWLSATGAALAILGACSKGTSTDGTKPTKKSADAGVTVATVAIDAPPAPIVTTSYDTLAAAITATVPTDAKVVGFGELHARTDRASVKSALSRFTAEVMPAILPKLSDLVIETWVPDPKCAKAQEVTTKVEMSMRRPQATRSEVGQLALAARTAKVQPHAMTITCDDYTKISPTGNEIDPEVLLNLTTRELARLVAESVKSPSKAAGPDRPWIAVYGGALHNDRFPAAGVEDWSYAAGVDKATADHFVEIDLMVPELAVTDPSSKTQPWYALVEKPSDKVVVWKRGERSFVVVLPKSPS